MTNKKRFRWNCTAVLAISPIFWQLFTAFLISYGQQLRVEFEWAVGSNSWAPGKVVFQGGVAAVASAADTFGGLRFKNKDEDEVGLGVVRGCRTQDGGQDPSSCSACTRTRTLTRRYGYDTKTIHGHGYGHGHGSMWPTLGALDNGLSLI